MSFTSLHNHSMYSNFRLLDALGKVPDMINRAHDLGYKGIAFTEHECISSSLDAVKFYYDHKDLPEWKGFKVILGNEIYLCDESVNAENRGNNIFPHFILLAKDAIGHEQIRKLSTIAWSHSFRDTMVRVPTYYKDLKQIIGENKGHVIGSTACLGSELNRKILSGSQDDLVQKEAIKNYVLYLQGIFGEGNFFLEMQPGMSEEQRYVNQYLSNLSDELKIPCIITTDTHYINKEDKEIHHIFLNSQKGDRETDGFYDWTYMMTIDEIHQNMDSYLGAEIVTKAIDNTDIIYGMIEEYDLRKPLQIPYIPLDTSEPDKALCEKWEKFIPLIQDFYLSEYSSDRHMIRELVKSLESKKDCQDTAHYQAITDCLNALLSSSNKMNVRWSAYLLQLKDYIQIAWDSGTLVGAGRGSGVGFELLYMLDITQIDPLKEHTKTFYWRFLNPYRASVLDIDTDIESAKKDDVIAGLRKVYGEDRVSKVATYSTVGTRSAILTAARGLGIDNDEAGYIASLVVADRGISRNLHQMYYGDDENDYKPVSDFVKEMDSNPRLWEVAQKIEGVISGCGSHAGGVVIVQNSFDESAALMKTASGEVVTQFDLEGDEEVSLIKIDLLCIEALDKMRAEFDLLLKYKEIEWQGSLKATYEKYIGVYNIERNDPKMWECLHQHKVMSFFQMEKESGHQAIALTKPQSVDDLAAINAVMRLMPQEKGAESPLEKFARFKQDTSLWYKEMEEAGLTKEEQSLLEPVISNSYGVCQSQEQMMQLVQIPECGGFDLVWADKLRKAIAKKKPKSFKELEEEYFKIVKDKHLSQNLTNYVWNVLICSLKGYGFCINTGASTW